MYMHGAEYSSLHPFLPANRLPVEFEGELESLDSYSAIHLFTDQLESSSNDNDNNDNNGDNTDGENNDGENNDVENAAAKSD